MSHLDYIIFRTIRAATSQQNDTKHFFAMESITKYQHYSWYLQDAHYKSVIDSSRQHYRKKRKAKKQRKKCDRVPRTHWEQKMCNFILKGEGNYKSNILFIAWYLLLNQNIIYWYIRFLFPGFVSLSFQFEIKFPYL